MTIDINKIFNDAVSNAVEAALAKLNAPLVARLDALSAAVAEDHATLTTYLSQPAPPTNFVRAVGDMADLVEQNLADLTTVLGAVYDIKDLPGTASAIRAGNADALTLAEQMTNRIDAKCEAMMSEHLDEHDHTDFVTEDDLADKTYDAVRRMTFTVEVD